MIEVKGLKKNYGTSFSLDIKELKIEVGESFGLVGNNGAGKTTFLRLALDLIAASEGDVFSGSENVAGNEQWKKYTGSYLDEGFLIEFLTPQEYFEFVGNLYEVNKQDIENFLEQYHEFLNDDILMGKKLIRDLSKGNKSKVGISAAIIGAPEVLILDEPFAHLDPSSQIRLKNILSKLRENNKMTLLLSSHDLKHVTEVCSRIALLEKGKIGKDTKTTPETLKELEGYFAV